MFRNGLLWVLFSCISFLSARERVTDSWEPTEFIWNFGIIAACDVGPGKNPFRHFATNPPFDQKAYEHIRYGDTVWLKCRFVEQFCHEVLPNIRNPFILVISDGDESFPSDCESSIDVEEFIGNEKIIHIFAQNCDYEGSSKKLSHLPIGIDFHTIAYKGRTGGWGEKGSPKEQEEALKAIIQEALPTNLRKRCAFVDFQLADTMHGEHMRYLQFGEDRTSIFHRLLPTGTIEYGNWMKRSALWKTKSCYAFSISPHGNGLDCHRTWEDLALGCIVIVKTSPLDPMYAGLPVVIVKDWSEVTKENMELWLSEYGDVLTKPTYREKLTSDYWLGKIRAAIFAYGEDR